MIGTSIIRPTVTRWRPTGASYDADALAYFAAMTVQPDATRKGLIDTLIRGLKTDGVWARLTGLQLFAAHNDQAGRVDVIDPSRIGAKVNSPTFITDRGFVGDGSSSYIDTLIPDSASRQDNASMGAYLNQAGGTNPGSLLWWSDNNSRMAANSGVRMRTSTLLFTPDQGTFIGLWAGDRSASTLYETCHNGVALSSRTNGSTAPVNGASLHTHKFGTTPLFSSSRLAMVFGGLSMDAAQRAAFYSRLLTYLTSIGAN